MTEKLEVVLKSSGGCYRMYCGVCRQTYEMVYVTADAYHLEDDSRESIFTICDKCLESGIDGMRAKLIKLKESIDWVDSLLQTVESLPTIEEYRSLQDEMDKLISEEIEREHGEWDDGGVPSQRSSQLRW